MRIFLSYALEDNAIAQTIASSLKTAEHSVWMDVAGIPGGDNWKIETARAIHDSDWFVVVYSPAHKKSLKRKLEFLFVILNYMPTLYIVVQPTDNVMDEPHVIDISDNMLLGVERVLDFFANPPVVQSTPQSELSVEELAREYKTFFTAPHAPLPERIFIAYSHHQRSLARDLAELLIRNTKAVFWDAKIKAGATWRQTIQKALDDATHLVVIWTPDAALSDEVEREVSYALAKRKVIVPVLSKEIPELPYHLHGLHYIVLDDDLAAIETPLLKAIAQFKEDEDIWQ